MTVAAEQGVVGLLAYLALLVLAFARLFRGAARGGPVRAGVAAAFAALVVHTFMYAAFLEDPLTWALLGVGTAVAAAAVPRAPAPDGRPSRSRSDRARAARRSVDRRARARRGARVGARPDVSRTTTPTTTWSGAASCSTGTSRPSRPTRRRPSTRSTWRSARCSRRSSARTPTARSCSSPRSRSSRSSGRSSGSAARSSARWPGALARAARRGRASRCCSTRPAPTSTCRSSRSCCGPACSRPSGRGAATPVMALLAVAGLLRPEAWILAGAYWLWMVWPRGRRRPGAATCTSACSRSPPSARSAGR